MSSYVHKGLCCCIHSMFHILYSSHVSLTKHCRNSGLARGWQDTHVKEGLGGLRVGCHKDAVQSCVCGHKELMPGPYP